MNEENQVSTELLQAYVDGELDWPERLRVLTAVEASPALYAELCELRHMKDLVNVSYGPARQQIGSSATAAHGTQIRGAHWKWPAGAGLAAGLFAGVIGLGLFGDGLNPTAGEIDASPSSLASQTATERHRRVVFHVSSLDMGQADTLLDQVELVLETYRQRQHSIRVEVVANNTGLGLLRIGGSPVAARIQALHERFPNLMFAACGNTLRRVEQGEGRRVGLLPQAVVIDSGVAEVTRRQKQGWIYMRI